MNQVKYKWDVFQLTCSVHKWLDNRERERESKKKKKKEKKKDMSIS